MSYVLEAAGSEKAERGSVLCSTESFRVQRVRERAARVVLPEQLRVPTTEMARRQIRQGRSSLQCPSPPQSPATPLQNASEEATPAHIERLVWHVDLGFGRGATAAHLSLNDLPTGHLFGGGNAELKRCSTLSDLPAGHLCGAG